MVPSRRPITIKALWLNRPCENKRHQKSVLSVFWVFIFLLSFSFSYSVIECTKLFGHETFNFIILFPLTFVNIRKQITLTSSSKSNIYANFKKFKKWFLNTLKPLKHKKSLLHTLPSLYTFILAKSIKSRRQSCLGRVQEAEHRTTTH